MKSRLLLAICLLLFVSLISFNGTIVDAATATKKVSIKYAGGSYYGEVKNGKPHGKGTMQWGTSKSYSGDWVDGKRSGNGNYVNKELYADNGFEPPRITTTKTIYNGQWKNDKKDGEGYLLVGDDGPNSSVLNLVNKGTFKNDVFIKGYTRYKSGLFYLTYEYKDSDKLLEISTAYDFFDTTNTFKKGKGGNIDNGFRGVEGFSQVHYATIDKKGNKNGTSYTINTQYSNDWGGPILDDIEITDTVNEKIIDEDNASAEVELGEACLKILKIISLYASGFDSVDALAEGFTKGF